MAARLVRSSGVGAGDLVVDVGAGQGAITAPLVATGASVLAVERDPVFVSRLHRRFADRPGVRVVQDDLRSVPLPRRPFHVVSSIPFAVTTSLLRRVLDPLPTPLAGAEMIVEWGLARRLTAAHPRSLEAAWWAARFSLRIRGRVDAACFSPAPRVDAAHLAVRRQPGVDLPTSRVLWTLLQAAYAVPGQPAWAVPGVLVPRRRAHRLALASGIDPPAPAATVSVRQWLELARTLAADPTVRAPALPRRLTRNGP